MDGAPRNPLTKPPGDSCAELFDLLPPAVAMATLLAAEPSSAAARWVSAVEAPPAMKALLWLYVDGLGAAHAIVQDLPDATGSYLHAVLHRREGDFSNSKYWFRRAGAHPVLSTLAGYDPIAFVDAAEAAGATSPAVLVETQRREWQRLFDHLNGGCA